MIRLLVDESVDKPIVDLLRENGHLIMYVAEMQPGITDDDVLELANRQQLPLLTADKDFGELTYRWKKASLGVILIRLAGLSPHQKALIALDAFRRYPEALSGTFSVISKKSVRIRHSSLT
jgi:predicted nuclease of predicted toxin-antitoxin system